MSIEIALALIQDGVTVGAIYALLAVALVLVFNVTRIIFIPQGEFVSYGALTLAALQNGSIPKTIWMLVLLVAAVALRDTFIFARAGYSWKAAKKTLTQTALPLSLCGLVYFVAPLQLPFAINAIISIAIVIPIGTLLYRLAYEPLESASVLVLLIASVGIHLALTGIGLVMFGAEGSRTPVFSDFQGALGSLLISGQSIAIVLSAIVAMTALWFFFGYTLAGKALRATAANRLGARIVGIRAAKAGRIALGLAAAIGAASGILMAPLSTIYYDTGFLIGLKGFIAAVIGGLVSYPIAALGALVVGLLESFTAFESSAFKDVIVFTLILPVLLLTSFTHRGTDEEQNN
jgi:branched-chain amino acid transport system permease protein